MAIQNALNLTATGIITHDGAGVFTGSTVTEGGVLLAGASNSVSDTGVLAKGVVLVGDATTGPTLLTVGSNDQVLTADSAQTPGVKWATPTMQGEPAPTTVNTISLFTDFMEADGSSYPFIKNGLSKVGTNASKDNPGVVLFNSSDSAWIDGTTGDGDYIGGGEITLFARHVFDGTIPADSSDKFLLGMSASVGVSAVNRLGIYFDPGVVAANWIITTVNASTATNTDTGTAMTNAGTWQIIKVVVNAAGTSIEVFIDGVSEGTQSTNIPATTTNMQYGMACVSWPAANGSDVDYLGYNQVMTGDRS